MERIDVRASALLRRLARAEGATVRVSRDSLDSVTALVEEGLVEAEPDADGALHVRLPRR